MNIALSPKKTITKFLYIISFLLFAHISGVISIHYFDHNYVYGLIPLFDFEVEMNVPSFYSFMALLLAGLLLSTIAFLHKKTNSSYIYWVGLSLIFLFLSVDELLQIHESISHSLEVSLNVDPIGMLSDPYILPYGVTLLIIGVFYLRFLIELPRKTMVLFIISGATYVTGALVLDNLGSITTHLYGPYTFTYYLLHTSEELFEMLGVAVFIYAQLLYINNQFNDIEISIWHITVSFADKEHCLRS